MRYQNLVLISRRLIKKSCCHNRNIREHVSVYSLFETNEVNTAVWLKVQIYWGVSSVSTGSY